MNCQDNCEMCVILPNHGRSRDGCQRKNSNIGTVPFLRGTVLDVIFMLGMFRYTFIYATAEVVVVIA